MKCSGKEKMRRLTVNVFRIKTDLQYKVDKKVSDVCVVLYYTTFTYCSIRKGVVNAPNESYISH